MAWARVDDGWWCHPKVLTLDLDARGLWISALSWSCQQQTSSIPRQIVAMCGDDGTVAAKLVDAGLWDATEDGWAVHDWDDYQSERAKKAAAGKLGGKASGESRRDAKQADEAPEPASREAETAASAEAGPTRPVPTQPNPTPEGKSERRKRRAPEEPLPDGWAPDDTHRSLAVEQGVDCDHEAAKFRDHAAANDRRQRDWDAAFRTWLRRARDYGATNGNARASPGAKGGQYAAKYREAAAELERQGR